MWGRPKSLLESSNKGIKQSKTNLEGGKWVERGKEIIHRKYAGGRSFLKVRIKKETINTIMEYNRKCENSEAIREGVCKENGTCNHIEKETEENCGNYLGKRGEYIYRRGLGLGLSTINSIVLFFVDFVEYVATAEQFLETVLTLPMSLHFLPQSLLFRII